MSKPYGNQNFSLPGQSICYLHPSTQYFYPIWRQNLYHKKTKKENKQHRASQDLPLRRCTLIAFLYNYRCLPTTTQKHLQKDQRWWQPWTTSWQKIQTLLLMVVDVTRYQQLQESTQTSKASHQKLWVCTSLNVSILIRTHTNVLKVGLFYLCLSSSQDNYNFSSLDRRLDILTVLSIIVRIYVSGVRPVVIDQLFNHPAIRNRL